MRIQEFRENSAWPPLDEESSLLTRRHLARIDRVDDVRAHSPHAESMLNRRRWFTTSSGFLLAATRLIVPGSESEVEAGGPSGTAPNQSNHARRHRRRKHRCGKSCAPQTFLGNQIEFFNERTAAGSVPVDISPVAAGIASAGQRR